MTAGNVLAPELRKKVTAVYVSFKELRAAVSLQDAWLPFVLVQALVVDTVRGGLSALTRRILRGLHNNDTAAGFWLPLPGRAGRVRVDGQVHLVSDMDAQRATFNNKGSAGIVPCLWCSNVLAGRHADNVAGCVPVHCSRPEFFHIRTDAQWFRLADELRAICRPRDIVLREKACGLNRCLDGLLFDPAARQILPPSRATVDSTHLYFEKGCAAWEVGYIIEYLVGRGVALEALRATALQSAWRRPAQDGTCVDGLLRKLFNARMYKAAQWRGQARQCRQFVFLLRYYVWLLVEQTHGATTETASFAQLHLCVRELRTLEYTWRVLRHADVQPLQDAQQKHQELFNAAWGSEWSKPKHHHRFHLPAACVALGFLPTCEIHEKKHTVLKGGGLVDRMEHLLSDGLAFQKAILPRMLQACAQEATDAFAPWGAVEPLRAAPQDLRLRLRDESARGRGKGALLERAGGDSRCALAHARRVGGSGRAMRPGKRRLPLAL